ncbi:LacI family DNA-binding transcriptional regulator [Streptomyces sp. DSM 15324]|uniref:LacI family DNA-binding transcriptional regulator n=1 Tax=Streptomyces sp. DSM 15324 TaxID=1739111 RepID=UPI00074B0F00|nr:LacI family DNA-binding transcriptional regulator [Streptomyces sp. DSM 15324]KUO07356.1 LacI family transcriptional regulator [Streptomyces sp. DSM 15324]
MVTMDDVARRAGVTKQTVSNVVRGRTVVSPDTRAKVEAAIAELGYQPNLLARSLATGTTMTVGFIVPTVANPFYSVVVEEVETVLEERGYHLLLATTRGDGERARRHLTSLSNRSLDALLVAGDRDLGEHVPLLERLGLPVALCMWDSEPPSALPVVTVDFEKAGYLAGRHLCQLGHRRPVVIADVPAHRVRIEGMRRAFAEVGVTLGDEAVLSAPGATPEAGYAAALLALAAPERPTCVLTSTDAIALGVTEAFRHHGLRVPEDISVVGIDDIPQAAHAHPPLTTVGLPMRRMARDAAELLLNAIRDKQPVPPDLSLLSPAIIRRESSAPPAQN